MKKQSMTYFKRIVVPMVILVIALICLFMGSMFYYGVFGQLKQNSEDIFNQQVTNRGSFLESELISKWSNIAHDVEKIEAIIEKTAEEHLIDMTDIWNNEKDSQILLSKVSHQLISLLRSHNTTGAYIFFSDGNLSLEETEYCPGIYINDSDPTSSFDDSNSDLLVSRCPVSLIKELNIPMSFHWRPSLEFIPEENEEYIEIFDTFKLLETNTGLQLKDVAKWTRPYIMVGSDDYYISYITPLRYNNKVIGAVGIDINLDYIKKMLPYEELSNKMTAGYVLAVETEDSKEYISMNSPYFTRGLENINDFEITDDIYQYTYKINLYNTQTPYEKESLNIVGIIEKKVLYQFTNQLFNMLIMTSISILVIGIALSLLISRLISNPIISLSKQLRDINIKSTIKIEKTHIIEVDQLINAIEKMSNALIDSYSKFTNIIELAHTKLAGFEIDYENRDLFVTERFFKIFLKDDIDTSTLTIEEFEKILASFEKYSYPSRYANEMIYHICAKEEVYLRLRYLKDQKRYIGLVEDISDTIKERLLIEHERDHDILTGLMNRRAFNNAMTRLFSVYKEKIKIGALVMLDLDNLKPINDKYGHNCGDAYIKALAEVLVQATPKSTIVSRVSGDEFYIFYYGYDSKAKIRELIVRLKENIKAKKITLPNQETVNVHISGGIAWYPEDSQNFEELQRFSDYAMYTVKHSTKGEIRDFDISDYENNYFVLKKRMELHQFLDNKMYTHHYQPIIDAKSGEVFAYEALLRSTHPTLKNPEEIISIAKLEAKLSNIEEITWVSALMHYLPYYTNKQVRQDVKLFINSLPNQIITSKTIDYLKKHANHLLDHIVLEVVENDQSNQQYMKQKHELISSWHGQIALDDYGSGYNSERNLLAINPLYVKVDRDIVKDIDKDLDKQKIVENLVSYCHERGKYVIAEGIETKSELQTVLRLNVDYLQGYLFAKPEAVPVQLHINIEEMKKS